MIEVGGPWPPLEITDQPWLSTCVDTVVDSYTGVIWSRPLQAKVDLSTGVDAAVDNYTGVIPLVSVTVCRATAAMIRIQMPAKAATCHAVRD